MTDKFNSKAIGLDVGLLIGKFFMDTEELHYGYWPDDKTVTAQNFSQAQDRHSQLIIDNIPGTVKHILDAPIISILEANNCDIVHEHEIVKAEIKGLEVARITEDRDGELKLQIGVGHYDQEAHKLVDLHEDPNEKLARVVADVLRYRNKEAKPHPLNRVARPAWLVSEIIAFPEKLNLQDVHRLMTPGKATTVKETTPAAALAKSDGKIVLLVASVGIDLKAIPLAAALSATEDADEIWMILPEKDLHPALKRQSSQLTIPIYFKTVQEPWPATLG